MIIISVRLLARDEQAKLALIVAQCLSIHLSICVSVRDSRQLESRICTQHCASRATSTTGLSLCLSVLVLRPGTEPSPSEIETPGFHLMDSVEFLVSREQISWVRRVPSNEGIIEGYPRKKSILA